MKLKYNHNGETHEIPLTNDKPTGKRLAVRHDNQTYYAPLVPTADSAASDIHLVFGGEIFAVQSQPPPKVTAVNVAPSSVAVMQGQSATATVSAVGNEYISGLSYGLSNAPTWITISDDVILIQPSDNDLGIAQVEVYAQDTGSDAMSSAILRAEAKLRPIIDSLSVIPPTVTAIQGESTTATISAVANEAVTGLSYLLDGNPDWMNLSGSVIYMTPTGNDSGSAAVTVTAQDTGSDAHAETFFNAKIAVRPSISLYNYDSVAPWTNTVHNVATVSVATPPAGVDFSVIPDQGSPRFILRGGSITLYRAALDMYNFGRSMVGNVYNATVQATAKDSGLTSTKVIPVKIGLGNIKLTESPKAATVTKASSGYANLSIGVSIVPYNKNDTLKFWGFFPKEAYITTSTSSARNIAYLSITYPKSAQTTVASPINTAYVNWSIVDTVYADNVASCYFSNLDTENAEYREGQFTL